MVRPLSYVTELRANLYLDGIEYEAFWLLAIGTTGFTAGILVSVFAKSGRSPASQLARCAMGITVAVIWIMAINDEVVTILQVGIFAST